MPSIHKTRGGYRATVTSNGRAVLVSLYVYSDRNAAYIAAAALARMVRK